MTELGMCDLCVHKDKGMNEDPCHYCEAVPGTFEFAYQDLIENAKDKAIKECVDKFADILSNIKEICGRNCPVKCDWGTENSCKDMCKKWLEEQLKEQIMSNPCRLDTTTQNKIAYAMGFEDGRAEAEKEMQDFVENKCRELGIDYTQIFTCNPAD